MALTAGTAAPRREAFAAWRLLLASLVIVSHTAQLVDGDARREPLQRLVGTTNLGFVAVSGFFVVSGYLVTASALRTPARRWFVLKRAARIYPGFLLASAVAIGVVLPLSGATVRQPPLVGALLRALLLQRPRADGAFPGQAFCQEDVALDGAMWTIPYEFGCYLLAACLARAGARRPWLVVAGAGALLAGSTLLPDRVVNRLVLPALLPGAPRLGLVLAGMFATGAAFFLLRGRLRFDARGAAVAAAGLALAVPIARLVPLTIGGCGGYLLIAGARLGARTPLRRLESRADVSYGLYLYGWPVGQLLIRYIGTDSLPLLAIGTLTIAASLGWLSWTLVERPVLRLVHAATGKIGSAAAMAP